jgi:T3SS (YopN, CesT) and YbjN peptide-binding chaperone 3
VLTAERVGSLAKLGWRLDTSFGNYVQTFPPGMATSSIADKLLQTLAEGYDAELADLEVRTAWVRSEPCPPRNGPSQNLAGMINNAPSMAPTAVHACSYKLPTDLGPSLPLGSSAELFDFYGVRASSEIQRLRVNTERHVFVVFEAGIGYVQCQPQRSPAAIYCEAQSAESWDALASVLTPERVAQLHAAGFADPGRSPNYWKNYPADKYDDGAIAREVLALLHDAYGYNGIPTLKVLTEDSRP